MDELKKEVNLLWVSHEKQRKILEGARLFEALNNGHSANAEVEKRLLEALKILN